MISSLPVQSEQESFTDLDLRLIIPKLHKEVAIVGVPLTESGWNISWLGNAAGYPKGTAFPTCRATPSLQDVHLPSGLPGPFVNIGQLSYGDENPDNCLGNGSSIRCRGYKRFLTHDPRKPLLMPIGTFNPGHLPEL